MPDDIMFAVPLGRHSPCLHGCVLTVERSGRITIEGPSRERLFEQLRRFLRLHCKGRSARQFAVVVLAPGARERDHYTAIVNADVAIVPAPLGAEAPLYGSQERP